jgi:putative CocE/NonD family hydrolase
MRSDHAPGYPFGQYQSLPVYKKIRTFSMYVPMRDGVRIAVTITMPDGLPIGMKLPALLCQTRYWRAVDYRWPMKWINQYNRKISIPYMAKHGYAVISVDVRGTGASFGNWRYPWSEKSFEDAHELVEWVIAQPWSNGKVGGYGGSYLGTTAELLAALQHPAVRAVIPMYNHPDPLCDISHPGGILNEHFMRDWGNLGHELDNNIAPKSMGNKHYFMRSVMPVDEDRDRALLAQAILEHATNNNAYSVSKEFTFRDTLSKLAGITIHDTATERYIEQLKNTPTAIFGWASFLDAATADAALRRFLTLPTAQRVMIAPCTHGGIHYADPYERTGAATPEDLYLHFNEWLRFFDAHLKDGHESPTQEEKTVIYYTFGENRWKQTSEWPPAGHRVERWYLNDNRALLLSKPSAAITDSYQVDWRATTGFYNRWWEIISLHPQTIRYPNRKEQTKHLLVYRTPPLESDLCITGHPTVTLYLSANAPDGALFVYLEDEDETGKVVYLTEGELRLLHRTLSNESSPYRQLVPYHTFLERDAEPMPLGEAEQVTLGLLATSALIRRGHRLRLSIAGHDDGTFARIPAPDNLTYTIFSDATNPSWLDLPTLREIEAG